jgi:hypothetical protein
MNKELERIMDRLAENYAFSSKGNAHSIRETGFINGFQACYAELSPQLTRLQKQLEQISKYCAPHTDQMWAAVISGIILECDFRDVPQP